jgi:hypothetical protein
MSLWVFRGLKPTAKEQVSLCDTGKGAMSLWVFLGLKPTAKEQVSLCDTIAG